MTNEEKQDIAAECRRLIAEASKEGAGYRTVAKGKVAKIALAALNAQPVKLPPRRFMLTREDIDQDYMTCMAIAVEDAIAAIRAAGYEVIE